MLMSSETLLKTDLNRSFKVNIKFMLFLCMLHNVMCNFVNCDDKNNLNYVVCIFQEFPLVFHKLRPRGKKTFLLELNGMFLIICQDFLSFLQVFKCLCLYCHIHVASRECCCHIFHPEPVPLYFKGLTFSHRGVVSRRTPVNRTAMEICKYHS